MKNANKITSIRNLAIELSHGPVDVKRVSSRLEKTVNMWTRRNEVKVVNGKISLS